MPYTPCINCSFTVQKHQRHKSHGSACTVCKNEYYTIRALSESIDHEHLKRLYILRGGDSSPVSHIQCLCNNKMERIHFSNENYLIHVCDLCKNMRFQFLKKNDQNRLISRTDQTNEEKIDVTQFLQNTTGLSKTERHSLIVAWIMPVCIFIAGYIFFRKPETVDTIYSYFNSPALVHLIMSFAILFLNQTLFDILVNIIFFLFVSIFIETIYGSKKLLFTALMAVVFNYFEYIYFNSTNSLGLVSLNMTLSTLLLLTSPKLKVNILKNKIKAYFFIIFGMYLLFYSLDIFLITTGIPNELKDLLTVVYQVFSHHGIALGAAIYSFFNFKNIFHFIRNTIFNTH